MKRKGFTLIELLVALVLIAIIISMACAVVFVGSLIFKGVESAENVIETAAAAKEERLVTNPPLYAIGDIVYHKASHKRMIVSKRYTSWNDEKGGWNIKVKDGGNYDAVGGFSINETEVTPTLKEVDKQLPE